MSKLKASELLSLMSFVDVAVGGDFYSGRFKGFGRGCEGSDERKKTSSDFEKLASAKRRREERAERKRLNDIKAREGRG